MKKILAIALLTSAPAFASTPGSNISIEYTPASITTDKGFETEANIISLGYHSYLNNNISAKFLIGMSKGTQQIDINGVDTRDEARVKYIVSTDIRYEYPLTNYFSTYALLGATLAKVETDKDILNETRTDFGLKLGMGASYAMSKNTALYLEVNQNLYKSDFEIQSYSLGFKFSF